MLLPSAGSFLCFGASLWWAIGLLCCLSSAVSAGQFEFDLATAGPEVTVENHGPAVTPRIYVVGEPDRSADPVRKTKAVALDGIRLTETLLSRSVLILYPNGTGRWGYYPGFDLFREPEFRNGKRVDPRSLVEYDKWRYDPLGPVRVVGGDMNLLLLFSGRPAPPARWKIEFPETMRIRRLRIESGCDQIRTPGVKVWAKLYADAKRSELLAQQTVGPDCDQARFPVEFDEVDRSAVVLELSAEATEGTVGLYSTRFEAMLDTTQVQLPRLGSGVNRLAVSSAADGSQRGRVVLRWEDRPAKDHIVEDFEEPTSPCSHCEILANRPGHAIAFTGQQYARIGFPADGRDHSASIGLGATDLSQFNRLGLALREVQPAPMRAVMLGLVNNGGAPQFVRLRPSARWEFHTFDIGQLKRDRATRLLVYFLAQRGFERPDLPCQYDVDTLAFWSEALQSEAESDKPELPEHIRDYRSPNEGNMPEARRIERVQEWFPMGIYDGLTYRSEKECVWLLDQMKKLKMDAVYLSNGTLEGLQRVLPLAEARGIRLIYQGTSAGALYYLHLATPEARKASLEKTLLPRAREWLPRFRERPGLAAWSLTEEITPTMSAELGPYYALVRQLAPNLPPTVLHNNREAARFDLEQNHPKVITHDFYPFFWNPRSGPSSPGRSLRALRGHVSSYYELCRKHDASLWMMVQSWGQDEAAPLDPPNYGFRTGMRTPQPGEIKQQGWLSVAEGATGLFYYATESSRPGTHHLWDAGFRETANTRAAGELFARLKRVGTLLCRLQRDPAADEGLQVDNSKVLVHAFRWRPGYAGSGRFVVLASLDGFGPQGFSFDLSARETPPGEEAEQLRVYDLVQRREITDRLSEQRLEAGEGTLLLIGSAEDYEAACGVADGR